MAWTCQRSELGVVCKHRNENKYRRCQSCGKPRPPRKRPAHRKALELPYEHYLALNGGIERCAICGAPPREGRKLDRDHCHRSGEPRGLLCHVCNRTLGNRITPDWLRRALAYLERRN